MDRDWTKDQRRAIDADEADICVAAGAGSGKTGVLVARFVRLVTTNSPDHADVDRILVITFTEKATREMKARIVDALNSMGMIAQRRLVETAYISTIHGFCSRLLQENPFDAGVDPEFTVSDENRARKLFRQAFDKVVNAGSNGGNPQYMVLVAHAQSERRFGEAYGQPLSGLSAAVESVMAKMRGAGITLSEVERHWLRGPEATSARSLDPVRFMLEPILSEIQGIVAAMRTLRSGAIGSLKLACDSLLNSATRLNPESDDIYGTISALHESYENAVKGRTGFMLASLPEIELARLFDRVRIICKEAEVLFHVTASRERDAEELMQHLWGLTVAVWKEYDQAKRTAGILDTDDLQAEAVRLLEQSNAVRESYRRRFRHLMIDEFQDTSPLQMRLIELLRARPSDSDIPTTLQPNSLFIVGDVQQSIYGFRQADARLFRDLERRFREDGAGLHVPLSVNFRSRPEILAVVRHVFKQVWRDEKTAFVPLTQGSAFDPKSAPSVEVLLSQDLMRRDYVRLEAAALAERIRRIVENEELRITSASNPRRGELIGYRDVCVLLRGLTDIEKYEQAFARRGIPYFVVGGGRGYFARYEIRDLMNCLAVVDTPCDDVAAAAALRSPIVGVTADTLFRLSKHAPAGVLTDADSSSAHSGRQPSHGLGLYVAAKAVVDAGLLNDEETEKLRNFIRVIEELRDQEDRIPVGRLLERLIEQTRYDARLLCRPGGRRRLANVRKLLQIANAEPHTGVREFIRRVRDLTVLSDREGDAPTEEEAADVVRFMTIHGAKGLEYPVVILADLSRGLLIPERGLFACEPECFALGAKLDGEPSLAYRAIDRRRTDADRKESERLLYVAMTRACEHLILCGNTGRNRGVNWGDNLFPTLGILAPPPEPETQRISGGVDAHVAPLSYYVHTPGETFEPDTSMRRADARANRLAAKILQGAPFEESELDKPQQ